MDLRAVQATLKDQLIKAAAAQAFDRAQREGRPMLTYVGDRAGIFVVFVRSDIEGPPEAEPELTGVRLLLTTNPQL